MVQDIATKNQCEVVDLLGNKTLLAKINAGDFVSDEVGLPTVQDIITELDKPGRDPRPEFQVVRFKDGVEKLTDLVPDMLLEGNVTNITNFGAFVDIGVHQDGLVHISAMANKFVKDPREIVKTGDIVKVKVMSVDIKRKRIALSMRLDDSARDQETGNGQSKQTGKSARVRVEQSKKSEDRPEGAFAAAFAKAKLGK